MIGRPVACHEYPKNHQSYITLKKYLKNDTFNSENLMVQGSVNPNVIILGEKLRPVA